MLTGKTPTIPKGLTLITDLPVEGLSSGPRLRIEYRHKDILFDVTSEMPTTKNRSKAYFDENHENLCHTMYRLAYNIRGVDELFQFYRDLRYWTST